MSTKKKFFRFFSIDWQKLHQAHQSRWVAVDLFMLVLVLVNLLFISFDWAFQFSWVQSLWQYLSPTFYAWYAGSVHPYFYQIDLVFVGIFIAEVLFRWGISIYKKSYDRWFFYPFIHWYDVLGCIPLNGGFRLFRFLRVFSLFYRLQRVGAIDISKTYIFNKATKYLNILVEEISDRVVVNVLGNVQNEVKRGNPVTDKIVQDVLLPRKEVLVDWMSQRIGDAVTFSYDRHKEELRQYIDEVVTRAVKENREIRTIEMIPGVGKTISATLDHAISDITFKVVDNMMNDLAAAKNKRGISEIADAVFETILEHHDESKELNALVTGMINDSLEVVKQEVMVQQWKLKEQEERENILKKRIEKELEKTFEDIPAGQ